MKRETTNKIRYVLEEVLPPVLRDSRVMCWLFQRYWGDLVPEVEEFRQRAHFVTEEEYASLYSRLPRIQEGTDNSEACISRIVQDAIGSQILDVGCGTGLLLQRLSNSKNNGDASYYGVDIHIPEELRQRMPEVVFKASKIEHLPFEDNQFDTVICTHVLEHILDIRGAVAELRRVCKQKLILVVPKEREYQFTFNPHLHFFAYKHSFLKHLLPVPLSAHCDLIGRDFYYTEDV